MQNIDLAAGSSSWDGSLGLGVPERPRSAEECFVAEATVLVALADGMARALLAAHLAEHEFVVVTAGDVREAVRASRRRRFDAVVIEGDERRAAEALAQYAWLAEAKVVAVDVPAADIDVDGADRVVTALRSALARRTGILAALAGNGAWGPLSDVGAQCLLDAVCAAGISGTLTVDDSVTSWRIDLAGGAIVRATAHAVVGGTVAHGVSALVSLVDHGGDAPFSFEPTPPALGPERALGAWRDLARHVLDAVARARDAHH